MALRLTKPIVDGIANAAKSVEEAFTGKRNRVLLDDFPRFVQLDGWSCGAQSAHAILAYFGFRRSIETTIRDLGTDEDGTGTKAMRSIFVRKGLVTRIVKNARLRDVRRALADGGPVLVSLYDGAHWAVVYGISRHRVYVADPSPRQASVAWKRRRFRRAWDRWAMIVASE